MSSVRRVVMGLAGLICVSLLVLPAAAADPSPPFSEQAHASAAAIPEQRADPEGGAGLDAAADPMPSVREHAHASAAAIPEQRADPEGGAGLDAVLGALPDGPEAARPAPAGQPGLVAPLAQDLSIPEIPAAPVVFTPADRLRSATMALTADLDRVLPQVHRKHKEALASFYASRGGRTLWTDARAWTPAGKAIVARLRAADEDGLDPSDYPVPDAAAIQNASEEDWAEAELKLSAAAIAYARDARGARIDLPRLSNLITPTLEIPEADQVLAGLAAADDPGAALGSYNPPHAGYRALKARLAEVRTTRPGPPMVRVPPGRALRVGMRDPRVPLIRARFGIGPAGDDQTAYDERVASAVAAFQKQKGLPASGVLTPATVAALSGPSPARHESDLVANMERWRWLPRDLGSRHVIVNVPEYRVRVIEDGDVIHQTRAIVGKSDSPTPIFSDEMEHVIVNPSWTVPPSILKKEFLPALARDPYYAERKGFKVIRRGDNISIQQPPGERNALGFIKFIFPNQHAVYLHDTPNRRLFGAERRAFSHGCVRVDQPFRLAEVILGQSGSWPEAKLKGLVGRGERHIRLQQPLPVHLTYFTTMVDDQGQLKSFDDLYGFHRKVRAALGFQE